MRLLITSLTLAALAMLGWRTFRVNWHPTYPAQGGLSPEEARDLALRLAQTTPVESSDLDVDFAPSRAALELFIDGERFFPLILRDIEAAQSSVHISEFEFKQSLIGARFASALENKRQHGVEVRMIVDRLASSTGWISRDLYRGLADAGVQIVQNDALPPERDGLLGGEQTIDWRFDEVAHLDHRKLFIIDGRIAWIGSAGIEDHFSDGRYHDVFVRMEGDAVGYLQTVFLTSFRFLGGPLPTGQEDFGALYPAPTLPGTVPVTVLHNVPREGHLATTDAIVNLIDNASRRLDIVSPFTADRGMIERIKAAAARGVAVRFVAPAHSTSWATAGAFEHYIPELQAAGVEVWLHPVFPHAKVVLADDRVLVGSTNLDAWALYRNWEVGILVDDAAFADVVRRELFDVDVARSSVAEPPRSLLIRGKNWALAALGPLL